jgi:hypothetical protein
MGCSFSDFLMRLFDEVLESKLWYVANKPQILRKWTPGMQVMKLTIFYSYMGEVDEPSHGILDYELS